MMDASLGFGWWYGHRTVLDDWSRHFFASELVWVNGAIRTSRHAPRKRGIAAFSITDTSDCWIIRFRLSRMMIPKVWRGVQSGRGKQIPVAPGARAVEPEA